jgi:biopolymer transport protein ExbB
MPGAMREIYDFLFVKGGYVMYPIVFCSVAALAIFLERVWFLQRGRIIPPGFLRLVRRLVSEGKVGEANAICEQNISSIATILAAGVRVHGKPREVIKEAIEDAGRHELANLERYMGALATIAGVATLLGLLGTITGMISVFQRVSESVGLDMEERTRLLSGGIWEALITTAAGLVIAVPTIVAHSYLSSKISAMVLEMEAEAMQLLDLLEAAAPSPANGAPPPTPTPPPPSGAAPPAPLPAS